LQDCETVDFCNSLHLRTRIMICSGWQEDLLVYHLVVGRLTRTYSCSSSDKYVQWSLCTDSVVTQIGLGRTH
ncbi:hypothetical protein, partial [uncultured Porphyromonas sp.]|uniref:hypothetical protein n=1 Tax=uncultured Porphyromonas sp. TaxID=159274 RepID=UPI0028055A86